jgi:diguanylate cyclase (GGDEF)-like protein/PAS domain S-box-containing protein
MRRITSLRLLLPVAALALLGLAIGLASLASREAGHHTTRETLHNQMRERINHLQTTAEQLLRLGMRSNLQQLVASIAAEPDLLYLVITDESGTIIASNRYAQVGERWRAAGLALSVPHIAAVQATKSIRLYNDPGERFIEGYASVCGETNPLVLRPSACGFLAYRVDLQYHYQVTDRSLQKQTSYFVTGTALVMLLLLVGLHLLVTRRTSRMVSALQAFVDGQRTTRVPVCLRDEISQVGHTVNQLLDELQRNEQDIIEQRERLRSIFDTVTDAIITIDRHGVIQSINPATERLFGYTADELLGQNVKMLMPDSVARHHDDYITRCIETGERRILGTGRELQAVTKDGREFAAELSVSEMQIGGNPMFTGMVRDISERVRMREALEQTNAELLASNQALWQSAKTDALTGLANRRSFDETLDLELRRAARQAQPLALLLLDLDYFKQFNDEYGHYEGDKCLRAVAKAIQDTCQRSGDLPTRYGGEEFAVVLPYTTAGQARDLAERIRLAVTDLQLPHRRSMVSDWVTTSIGVAACHSPTDRPVTPSELFNAADQALYQAKAEGRNRVAVAAARNTKNRRVAADRPAE